MPLVRREMRVASRQPLTYWLRVLGAAGVLVQGTLVVADQGLISGVGQNLFFRIHLVLVGAIWLLAPMLTADCLSRERREGTLGLLFLTYLSPAEIVLSKCLANALRALTLWLAMLPVMVVPFLVGGVGWEEVLLSLVVSLSAGCWALATGLVVSAWCRNSVRALLSATGLAALGVCAWATAHGWVLLLGLRGAVGRWGWWGFDMTPLSAFRFGLISACAWGHLAWPHHTRGAQIVPFLAALAGILVLGGLVLAAAIGLAAWRTRRTWQEEPPSPRQVWLTRTFCTPRFLRSRFARWSRWTLDRNPIGWLHQRTWSGRLTTWGWMAVTGVLCLLGEAQGGSHLFHDFPGNWVPWLVAGSVALSAARSFRVERETRLFELLRVSPLGERAILFGRLRSLWGQFLPMLAFPFVWYFLAFLLDDREGWEGVLFCAAAVLALPVIGLFFSLRCRSGFVACLFTLGCGLLVPLLVSSEFLAEMWKLGGGPGAVEVMSRALAWSYHDQSTLIPILVAVQLLFAVAAWPMLGPGLVRRSVLQGQPS